MESQRIGRLIPSVPPFNLNPKPEAGAVVGRLLRQTRGVPKANLLVIAEYRGIAAGAGREVRGGTLTGWE